MGVVKDTVVTERGLRAEFVKAFGNGEMESRYESLIMRVSSDKSEEKYGWLADVPQLREWVDERKLSGLSDFSYTLANKSYEATLAVNRDELEDDQVGAIKVRIADLAGRAKTHPVKLIMDLMANGATTGLGFDGIAFYSTTHTLDKGVTVQSNKLTGAGTTFANIQADFRAARTALRGFKDSAGEVINQGDLKLAIVCPPSLEGIMREVFIAERIQNGSSNVEVGQVAADNIHVTGRLSGNSWYINEISDGVKPFIVQTRRNITFNSLQDNSETGFMRKQFAYGVDYRVGAGYGLWQKSIKVVNS